MIQPRSSVQSVNDHTRKPSEEKVHYEEQTEELIYD